MRIVNWGGLGVGLWLSMFCPQCMCLARELTLQPSIMEQRYCINEIGVLSLRVKVRFIYHNSGDRAIVLPQFGQIAQYALFRDEESMSRNQPEGQEQYRPLRFFDEKRLDSRQPNPKLFDILAIGEDRERIHEVSIVLHPQRRRDISLLGMDPYLQIEINHWFGSRKAGMALQRTWRNFGVLWIDNLVAPPIKLHIDKNPQPQRCRGSID